MKYLVIFFGFILIVSQTYAQSDNDDNFITEKIKVKEIFKLPDKLSESSGLIKDSIYFYTHNDGGDKATIYRIELPKKIEEIKVSGAKNKDWEDITIDPEFIYIGDFGNNNGKKEHGQIYKIKKSDIYNDSVVKVNSVIRFSYEDYIKPSKKKHNFDCEAFAALNGNLYLFTKNRKNHKTNAYVLNTSDTVQVAQKFSSFDVDGLITAADFSNDGKALVLLGYSSKLNPFLWYFYDFKENDFFGGKKIKLNITNKKVLQAEGICFDENNDIYITCETYKASKARMFKVNAFKLY